MNETDDRRAPVRVLATLGAGLVVAVLVVALVWVLNLARVSALPELEAVSAPAPAVEVSAEAAPPTGQQNAAPASRVRVDATWSARVSSQTGIPQRALEAYALADLVVDAEQPACGIGWNTLAGIGAIETDHGRHDGAVLGADGYPSPAIRGPQLDGNGNAAISDTDGGAWDGDTVWDRAVGPMQFIPDTWARWGADGNGDGTTDPNQIDDAALATARYLCHSGSMTSVDGWRAAIFSYNHLDVYVDDVAAVANRYATAAR
ncbi:lytic transglycosylase domain-containing protein [Microbacterium sp. P04]|uniref:lytic transglycosylase domain-containing protein n=1 Tax=Microbacterium sp. P04 TaxID=3366947 RepID=UPI003745EF1D